MVQMILRALRELDERTRGTPRAEREVQTIQTLLLWDRNQIAARLLNGAKYMITIERLND